MNDIPIIFDRKLVALRRSRAAATLPSADFLLREAAEGVADRLATVTRGFPLAVDLGAQTGLLGERLRASGKVELVVSTESCPPLLPLLPAPRLACDEEALPFAPETLDLIASALTLHLVNDLPGTLVQIRRALKPDGLFLAALLGGNSLVELRQALMDAEIEISGGASPRVAPLPDLRDTGGLLQRAGFALPVVDAETLTVRYATPFDLIGDLGKMGWRNAMAARSRRPLRRDVLMRAMELYGERHTDADGRVRSSFEIIYVSGWAPHESQQKPLQPGSARARLADALSVRETPVSGTKRT